jgi:hypothetical protein
LSWRLAALPVFDVANLVTVRIAFFSTLPLLKRKDRI